MEFRSFYLLSKDTMLVVVELGFIPGLPRSLRYPWRRNHITWFQQQCDRMWHLGARLARLWVEMSSAHFSLLLTLGKKNNYFQELCIFSANFQHAEISFLSFTDKQDEIHSLFVFGFVWECHCVTLTLCFSCFCLPGASEKGMGVSRHSRCQWDGRFGEMSF